MPNAARVRFHDDTLREMANWAAKRYGLRLDVIYRASIVDDSGKQSAGCSQLFKTDPQYIELSMRRKYRELVDVLAHELAHVVAFKKYRYAGHGPKFGATLRTLIAEWNKQIAGDKR